MVGYKEVDFGRALFESSTAYRQEENIALACLTGTILTMRRVLHAKLTLKILMVEDFEPFRRIV